MPQIDFLYKLKVSENWKVIKLCLKNGTHACVRAPKDLHRTEREVLFSSEWNFWQQPNSFCFP